ncbi:hypothetical protein, partial [Pseudomonas aeruginosa]|uniref:hypothetical protein n=1 Tax=Pseudomonas aeruginosa TaxID=287 RepID=UPI003F8D11DC
HEWVASTIGIQQSWYLQFVLTLLVLAIPGWRFYEKGFPALFRLGPDMNSLVAVARAASVIRWSPRSRPVCCRPAR